MSADFPPGRGPLTAPSTTFAPRGRLGSTVLDNCFTDLERDDDGLTRVALHNPDDGAALALWVDEAYPYVMVFTGDPLRDVARSSIAVSR